MMEWLDSFVSFLEENDNSGLFVFIVSLGLLLLPLPLVLISAIFRKIIGRKKEDSPNAKAIAIFLLYLFICFFGFLTQLILYFLGVPPTKMVLIWLLMLFVYVGFFILNIRLIEKLILSSKFFLASQESKNQDENED